MSKFNWFLIITGEPGQSHCRQIRHSAKKNFYFVLITINNLNVRLKNLKTLRDLLFLMCTKGLLPDKNIPKSMKYLLSRFVLIYLTAQIIIRALCYLLFVIPKRDVVSEKRLYTRATYFCEITKKKFWKFLLLPFLAALRGGGGRLWP